MSAAAGCAHRGRGHNRGHLELSGPRPDSASDELPTRPTNLRTEGPKRDKAPRMCEGLRLCSPVLGRTFVAGAGFEPATSGFWVSVTATPRNSGRTSQLIRGDPGRLRVRDGRRDVVGSPCKRRGGPAPGPWSCLCASGPLIGSRGPAAASVTISAPRKDYQHEQARQRRGQYPAA